MTGEFTVDWTSARIAAWREHLVPLFKDKPTRMLEIGVWEGRSAIWFLNNLLTHERSTYRGVDSYESREEIQRDGHVSAMRNAQVNLKPYDKAEVVVERSALFLAGNYANRQEYDLIRVDGSHRADHALLDITLSWQLLKVGGVILIDDYDPSGKTAKREGWGKDCPQVAADSFFDCIRSEHKDLLYTGYEIGIVRK